jgi:hypothetical protein
MSCVARSGLAGPSIIALSTTTRTAKIGVAAGGGVAPGSPTAFDTITIRHLPQAPGLAAASLMPPTVASAGLAAASTVRMT